MKMHVKIMDNTGKVIVDHEIESPEVTDAQVDAMMSLIAAGVPAWIAANLVINEG